MIGDRIKHFRKAKQLSQEQLAKSIGLSQSAFSRLESESRNFDIHLLQHIAKCLSIDVTQLLNADLKPTDPDAIIKNYYNSKSDTNNEETLQQILRTLKEIQTQQIIILDKLK